ncbi:MAG: hypothetical protein IJ685_07820 [Selenomonadaceae bacterium]|nr:hypothetical protein [Selenomonadaceae bacterium]
MKKIFLLAFAIIFCATNLVDAATPIKNHPRIAVCEFANKAITSDGFRDQDYSSATEYAIYQLSVADWFDLIDYEQMVTVARMHSINRSGMFDPSTVPQLGKFLAAEYILVGALTGMTVKENDVVASGAGAKVGVSKYTVTANVTVRFVDVETLKIVGVGMGTGKSSSAKAEISFSPFRNAANWIVPRQTNIIIGDGNTINNGVISTGDTNFGEYSIKIGAAEVSMVQARNALSKAIQDAVYGENGILTNLNGGKKLKIKTGF